jgi:hypothetical protein
MEEAITDKLDRLQKMAPSDILLDDSKLSYKAGLLLFTFFTINSSPLLPKNEFRLSPNFLNRSKKDP